MLQRAAVLDLGTNTFNLLIGERAGDEIVFLHRDERWVNLAENGMDRIGDNALQRMADVLTAYKKVIGEYNPQKVKASATAMFRRASNSDVANGLVEEIIGLKANVVSGDEEAQLIYDGIRLSPDSWNETVLVMDIGGGSTEFIIGNGDLILWKKSYALGATLLRRMFHKTEPITTREREALREYVLTETVELQRVVETHKPKCLIGASGSFDSFASMLRYPDKVDDAVTALNVDALNALVDRLCGMNETQRNHVPGLVWFRVGPIVTAALLTETVIGRFGFDRVYRSPFAMKEGMLRRLLFS